MGLLDFKLGLKICRPYCIEQVHIDKYTHHPTWIWRSWPHEHLPPSYVLLIYLGANALIGTALATASHALHATVQHTLGLLLATTFLKSSRWVSVTLNLVSRLVDRIELNKYIQMVHSIFVMDLAFSTALIFAVSALLIFLDTFPLSYLPPRSLTSDSYLASFEGEECTVPSLGQCTVRLYQSS